MGEVRWIDDGFRGLLPLPFNSTLGGTAAAPPYFNNKNKASDEQYVIYRPYKLVDISKLVLFSLSIISLMTHHLLLQLSDLDACTFLVELQLNRPYITRGSDMSTWEVNKINLLLFTFPCVIILKLYVSSSGRGSTALPGQGALTCLVSVIFYPIPVAGEERIWPV